MLWIAFLGIRFERHGDELTAVMPYQEKLTATVLPALHGATLAETAAIIELSGRPLEDVESGAIDLNDPGCSRGWGKTIDFTVDYSHRSAP